MNSIKFDPTTIPAELNKASFIGDILVAYKFATREQVDAALRTQAAERAALTEAEKAAKKRTRLTGQILVDDKICTQEQVDFGMTVQNHLRPTA
jgi:hypothetical protein